MTKEKNYTREKKFNILVILDTERLQGTCFSSLSPFLVPSCSDFRRCCDCGVVNKIVECSISVTCEACSCSSTTTSWFSCCTWFCFLLLKGLLLGMLEAKLTETCLFSSEVSFPEGKANFSSAKASPQCRIFGFSSSKLLVGGISPVFMYDPWCKTQN